MNVINFFLVMFVQSDTSVVLCFCYLSYEMVIFIYAWQMMLSNVVLFWNKKLVYKFVEKFYFYFLKHLELTITQDVEKINWHVATR